MDQLDADHIRKQRLRFRRFVTSAAAYGMCSIILLICYALEIVRLSFLQVWLFIFAMAAVNGLFLVLIKTNVNLRMKDPSLTVVQILAAQTFTLTGLYFVNEARTSLSLVLILSNLFGIYKLKTRDFFLLSVLAVVGYGVIVALLYKFHPEVVNLHVELLQVLMLIIVMYWISLIGGYISYLQDDLRKTNRELVSALETNKFLAAHDELTGLLNRRRLNEVLDHERLMASRGDYDFFLCLLDLDRFKKVNDDYGHQAGDMVLCRFAELLKHSFRRSDFVARFGGEEFMVVLTGATREGAIMRMEKLREATAQLAFSQIGPQFQITVSIGITNYKAPESIEQAVSRADHSLYRAKEQGRNRTEHQWV